MNEEAEKLRGLATSDNKGGELLLRAADRLDQMDLSNAMMKQLLRRLEWSSFRQGQGDGYMSSGGNGPLIPACPVCGNVHPEEGKGHFIAASRGHKSDCEFWHNERKDSWPCPSNFPSTS